MGIDAQNEIYNFLFYSLLTFAFVIAMLISIYCYCRLTMGMCNCETSMTGKTIIITGANAGIGKETALALAKKGAKIIMACRDIHKGQKAMSELIQLSNNENITVRSLDLCSFKSVQEFAKSILETEDRLDVLINNAGILGSSKRETTEDGCEKVIQSNHLGHFLLTNLLLDLLKKSSPSRIINVSSTIYLFSYFNINDLHSKRFYTKWLAYSNSKLANILFTRELAKYLNGTGVTANCLHPGVVRSLFLNPTTGLEELLTKTVAAFVGKNPYQGAQTSIHLVLDPSLEKVSGKFFTDCKRVNLYRPAAVDDRLARDLWKISEETIRSALVES